MLPDKSIPRTRITIPHRRKDLVSRQRLLDLLDELIEKRLILISAPSGYGKTTLLLDYTAHSELPVCWYSISAIDAEPQRFIANLVEAICVKFPAFGQHTKLVIQSGQGGLDLDYITTVLINDMYDHISEHFIIVLDDYQLVNDNLQVRAFLSRFLQEMDENCHVILTSRSLLTLPVLPMMVARSEVGGISFEELEFSTDEIQQYFILTQNHILTEEKAQDIYNRTEGWITGILLTSQVNTQAVEGQARLARISGSGLGGFYLELINQQTDDIRLFLLRSSLLEEFNPELCEQVIAKALNLSDVAWGAMFAEVQRNNLFALPVGDDGAWLRYHHLFLEYLQARMWQERPEEARAIENQLAQLYMSKAQWENAFNIFRTLKQDEDLVKLVELAGSTLFVDGRLSTLSGWLDGLPIELASTRPYIIALQGAVAFYTGDNHLALTLYNQSINAMHLPEDKDHLAVVLLWRASIYRQIGNLTASIADARETLGLVENSLELRDQKAEACRTIGICFRLQGRLHDALNWLSQALSISQSIKDRKNVAIIQMELGSLYENLGDYTPAKEMFQQAIEYWKRVDNAYWLSNLLNNLGVVQQMIGDYQGAVDSLENGLHYARSSGNTRLEAFILAGIADVYSELEAVEEAQNAYQQAQIIAQRVQENFLLVYLNLQEAALISANGDFTGANKLIQDARRIAEADHSEMEIQLCAMEYGGVKIREGNPLEAIEPLQAALNFFEQQGHKAQTEKTYLYLVLAYGSIANYEKLFSHLLKLSTFLDAEYPPVSLIATAARFSGILGQMGTSDFVGTQLSELFTRIDRFHEQLPGLRRYLRQRAVAVPFAPATYTIRALGKMQVKVSNRLITNADWQTQIARDLFFKLLAQPEGMTKEEIGLVFWPDALPDDLKFRIKNTVYRLRHAIGKDAILLDQDNYRFNNTLDYDYDVELFLRENAMAQQSKDTLKKLSHYREAVKLYKGSYLPEINETWVLAPREALQQIFLNILLQVAELYMGMGNYDLALDYCQRALNEDNCLEAAYRLSLKIYAAMGNRAALVRQYQRCVEVLQREINTDPSPQTQSLYQELVK